MGQDHAPTGATTKRPAKDTMTNRDASSEHAPGASRPAESGDAQGIDLAWSSIEHADHARTRRSRRRSAIAATITASFFVLMVVIGTAWSFLLSLGAVLAVSYWDSRLRSDPSDTPVLVYFASIVLGGLAVLAVGGLLLLFVMLVLP